MFSAGVSPPDLSFRKSSLTVGREWVGGRRQRPARRSWVVCTGWGQERPELRYIEGPPPQVNVPHRGLVGTWSRELARDGCWELAKAERIPL